MFGDSLPTSNVNMKSHTPKKSEDDSNEQHAVQLLKRNMLRQLRSSYPITGVPDLHTVTRNQILTGSLELQKKQNNQVLASGIPDSSAKSPGHDDFNDRQEDEDYDEYNDNNDVLSPSMEELKKKEDFRM